MTWFPRLKKGLILALTVGSLAGMTRGVVWSQTAQSDENRAFVKVIERPQRLQREQQARRVALVIGNASYTVGALNNPVHDAEDMAAVLEKLGFDQIILAINANQSAMEGAVDDFLAELGNSHAGVFYYAGHGMQLEGENYLIPVDATIESKAAVRSESLALDKVLERMQKAGSKINMILLDASRDNPFVRQWPTPQRGLVQRGLAKTESGDGTLIAYATAPGKVADDGEGRNGTFTAALLKYIDTPGQDVVIMLRAVRNKVIGDTKENLQVPWFSSSLTEGFFFNPVPALFKYTAIPGKDVVKMLLAVRKKVIGDTKENPQVPWSSSSLTEGLIFYPIPGQPTHPPISSTNDPIRLSFQDFMVPAGWMSGRGEPSSFINLNEQLASSDCHTGIDCLKIEYKSGAEWAGIMWWPLDCGDSWECAKRGTFVFNPLQESNLSTVERLTFWAKGESGNEVFDFKVGAVDFLPTPGHRVRFRLTSNWQKYEIDLRDSRMDFNRVVAGLIWIATDRHNPQGASFLIDDIQFEGSR